MIRQSRLDRLPQPLPLVQHLADRRRATGSELRNDAAEDPLRKLQRIKFIADRKRQRLFQKYPIQELRLDQRIIFAGAQGRHGSIIQFLRKLGNQSAQLFIINRLEQVVLHPKAERPCCT